MVIGGSVLLSLGSPKAGFDGPVICDGLGLRQDDYGRQFDVAEKGTECHR